MSKQMKITKTIAKKVISTVNQGLCQGLGVQEKGKMCVEAAVCYALGLPHSDNPPCVSQAIRAVKIGLNDAQWSSNEARGKGMLKLAVLQLGTSENFDDKEFVKRLTEMTIGIVVPSALRHAASIHPDLKHKQALEEAAIRCEKEKSKSASDAASDAASYAARAASYAARAASDAASDAARAAASYAASYAAWAASDAARAAVSDARAQDKELLTFAKGIEDILIDMKVPGVQWLELI